MKDNPLDYKSPDFDKLIEFGFVKNDDTYSYDTKILNGQFKMSVDVSANDEIKTELLDSNTDEPYTLHLVAEAQGAFVGAVRAEYEKVLVEIADKCFKPDVFKSDCAHKVINYVRQKYGDELQYLWKTFPSNAVWRRKDNDKWYGILMILSKRKLGLDSDEKVDVIDVRIDPDELARLKDDQKYFAGYHMNKKTWMTVCLDDSVSVEEIYGYIDKSHEIARKVK